MAEKRRFVPAEQPTKATAPEPERREGGGRRSADDAVERTHGTAPLAAWFLGPKAEHGGTWKDLLGYVFEDYVHWRRNYFPADPVVISHKRRREHEAWLDELSADLDVVLNDLKGDFPFYHPRYIAHMLSEQTLPSVLGHFAGMLYNPNNVTEEAAPVTVRLELQVGQLVAEMLGYKSNAWAHITSGGTVANLEALWVARTVQFVPFVMRELCKAKDIDFTIKTPNGKQRQLKRITDDDLLVHLRPNENIFMPRKLARYLVDRWGANPDTAFKLIQEALEASPYNPARAGVHSVAMRLGKQPRVFVSAAAHYSIAKACNLLGYGEDAVRLVPVTDRFRLDVDALEEMLTSLSDDEYVAAVVGIVGTTEEGAVDPIHELHFLRQKLAAEQCRSFWLHVDAAWGGYIASLFRGHRMGRRKNRTLDEIADDYEAAIGAREEFYVEIDRTPEGKQRERRKTAVHWGQRDLFKAFLALPDADSITVDPHKLGYVPYPVGIVAFQKGLVTELISQKANYISEASVGTRAIDEAPPIDAVGPYILEGSKPGAAASACWLAHKSIPLEVSGHGKIMRTTLLNAGKLARYLQFHRHLYFQFEYEYGTNGAEGGQPFTFELLFTPDTNIICFVARPMAVQENELAHTDAPLRRINEINRSIYGRMGSPPGAAGERMPYGHPFFVSRTVLEQEQYSSRSIKAVLSQLRVTPKEYAEEGLFVLRSAVMNPHYHMAEEEAGNDYLMGFVRQLHRTARAVLGFREPTFSSAPSGPAR